VEPSLLIVVGVAMDTVTQIEAAAHHAALRRLYAQEWKLRGRRTW